MKYLLAFLVSVALSSCSFNRIFMSPAKLPNTTVEKEFTGTFRTQDKKTNLVTDSTVFSFFGKTYQPVFIKHKDLSVTIGKNLESVIFKSKSGNDLNGWLIKPLKPTLPLTTILILHGNSGNLIADWEFIDAFVKNGFQVFIFDYSGFGFSTGKATDKNLLADGLSAVDYITTRPEVKGTNLFIYGQSLGGHLSAVVAQKREAVIDGLIIEAGFTSPQDIGSEFIKRSPLKPLSFMAHIIISSHFKAKRSIVSYHKPLLVIHSKEDEVIPFSMGEELYKRAGSAKKELYEIKFCHGCAMYNYANEISDKIKALSKSYVK